MSLSMNECGRPELTLRADDGSRVEVRTGYGDVLLSGDVWSVVLSEREAEALVKLLDHMLPARECACGCELGA